MTGLQAAVPPAIGVAGPSDSGKTTLICRLVEHFSARGWRVAVVKHSHHAGWGMAPEMARRLHRTGVAAAGWWGPGWLQATVFPQGEPALDEVLALLAPEADLILVEGYKSGGLPKIALIDPRQPDLMPPYPHLIALVSPMPSASALPVFAPEEIGALARFISRYAGLER
ncbi:MAG: molybdopterin-guanine dinucleotide biosynthesis protein B [Deltaproteobacteria bacterium]|nr:molybdopterin-guanine dinucleotide biosynthesis protein B [Deltaproteobacteria bacterium]